MFQAAGFTNVAEFKKVHGSDLFIRDIEEYDRICKVLPSIFSNNCRNRRHAGLEVQVQCQQWILLTKS